MAKYTQSFILSFLFPTVITPSQPKKEIDPWCILKGTFSHWQPPLGRLTKKL